jgi:hypothetical protein
MIETPEDKAAKILWRLLAPSVSFEEFARHLEQAEAEASVSEEKELRFHVPGNLGTMTEK